MFYLAGTSYTVHFMTRAPVRSVTHVQVSVVRLISFRVKRCESAVPGFGVKAVPAIAAARAPAGQLAV